MKVNGIDARKYDAKQLTVDIQPPELAVNYEWPNRALQPKEFKTDVMMGHLKMCVYFKGKDRNSIIRKMSEFMGLFVAGCDLELDGYKGKYKGFLTSDNFEKTITKKRYMLNLEFDGYFYDDELKIVFDKVTKGNFYMVGSRKASCIVEVYAKSRLENYVISGLGKDDIIIESLEEKEKIIIDGVKGIITYGEGSSAFERVNLWEFPFVRSGKNELSFSENTARVEIRYKPMWI